MPSLLGRTNQTFPDIWLSLSVPHEPTEGWLPALTEAAVASGAPLDISSSPGLWGGTMRGTDAVLMTLSDPQIEHATDEKHASDLTQAHLIESLCSIGREHLDFYFLRVRRTMEEAQLSGFFAAVEAARQEGHIRFIGLCCDGPALATLATWQFHDAFDVLLVPHNRYDGEAYDLLSGLAKERRVGVVGSRPLNWGFGLPFPAIESLWRLRNLSQSSYGLTIAQAALADLAESHPVLVGVRSPEEIRQALEAPTKPRPEGWDAVWAEYRAVFDDDATWAELAKSGHTWIRACAERRAHERASLRA